MNEVLNMRIGALDQGGARTDYVLPTGTTYSLRFVMPNARLRISGVLAWGAFGINHGVSETPGVRDRFSGGGINVGLSPTHRDGYKQLVPGGVYYFNFGVKNPTKKGVPCSVTFIVDVGQVSAS